MKNKGLIEHDELQNIIGKMPTNLLYYGTIIICFALLIILFVSIMLPYKEKIRTKIKINTLPESHFIYSSDNGFLISKLESANVSANNTIGYIINIDTVIKIKSPISGTIFIDIQNKELIDKEDLICIIIPTNYTCYAQIEIPFEKSNNIKIGDRVFVNLNTGEKTEAIIRKITQSNFMDKYFVVQVDFINKLEDKFLNRSYMTEVVIKETSLLKKILSVVGIK